MKIRAVKNFILRKKSLWMLRASVYAFKVCGEVVFIRNKKNQIGYFFPYSTLLETDIRQLKILSRGFHQHLIQKYTDEEFRIKKDDVVLDCGAFVGGLAVAASKSGAARIVCVEPSSKNRRCLKMNLSLHDVKNVDILGIALGDSEGEATLNLSASGCDDSLLAPDEGAMDKTEVVLVRTVEDVAKEMNIKGENLYLKVEAEGFEPEIIAGLGELRPRVIVVDVTPERDGASPREQIELQLKEIGYNHFHHTERCLFSKLD